MMYFHDDPEDFEPYVPTMADMQRIARQEACRALEDHLLAMRVHEICPDIKHLEEIWKKPSEDAWE